MTNADSIQDRAFQTGDNVFLAEGTYQGTPAVFVKLTEDLNWADLKEGNGNVRSHPLAWIRHVDN
jgi:hypothetical protein